MLRRTASNGLVVALAAMMLSGCGSSSSPKPTVGNGTLFTLLGDTPFCDVLSFNATVEDLMLPTTANSSAAGPHLVNNSTTFIKVDFTQLRDFSTILNINSTVPAGTYNQIAVQLGEAELTVFDPTQTPPIRVVTATINNKGSSKLAFANIDPPLVIPPPSNGVNQVVALRMDFDLARSIQLDAQGQVTGTINPVITATPLTADPNTGFAELDDLKGFIQRVDTTNTNTSNPSFIGDFALQLLSDGGPSVLVSLTNDNQLCGPATSSSQPCAPVPLNQLLTGSFVEVNAFIDGKGNLVAMPEANSIQVQDQESVAKNKLAYVGSVLPTGTGSAGNYTVTRDAAGNVTQFNLFVREEEPNQGIGGGVALDSVVQVNVSPSTVFQNSSLGANFANLEFGPTAVAVGQEVVVHGVFTRPASTGSTTTPPTTVAADSIYLKPQTHEGNFAALLVVGSDDRTGGFKMIPCASMFQGAPIFVFTDPTTAFLNVSGLSALSPGPSLLVKGMLFYELQGTTINGVAVPPGTLVLLARQVHQLS